MSPDARLLVRLAAAIRRDLEAAKERLDAVRERRDELSRADPVLASFAALSLHAYYTAIETACERISRHFDGGVPSGERSHHELLEAMSLDLPGLRPAVLSEHNVERLRELLGFRHFVRHAYSVAWQADRLVDLTDLATEAHDALLSDMGRFLSFVDSLAAAS